MSPAGHDEVRAVAALLAIAAHDRGHRFRAAALGAVLGSADESGAHLVPHQATFALLCSR